MNASTIIAIVVITALVVWAVISTIRKRKDGSACCGCAMKDCCGKAR